MRAPSVPMHRRVQGAGASRRLRYGAIAAAALLLPTSILPSLSAALMWPIQSRFQRTDLETGPEIAGFIALGGDMDRVKEAVALGLRHRETKVAITGQDPLPADSALIEGDRLRIEGTATTTYENAVHTARMLGAEKMGRWVLVTSASHMPRAMGCFRKAGFTVEAWPVPDRTRNWRKRLQRAAHEWAGLLVYWLDGRTDALFPSPLGSAAITTAAVAADRAQVARSAIP